MRSFYDYMPYILRLTLEVGSYWKTEHLLVLKLRSSKAIIQIDWWRLSKHTEGFVCEIDETKQAKFMAPLVRWLMGYLAEQCMIMSKAWISHSTPSYYENCFKISLWPSCVIRISKAWFFYTSLRTSYFMPCMERENELNGMILPLDYFYLFKLDLDLNLVLSAE